MSNFVNTNVVIPLPILVIAVAITLIASIAILIFSDKKITNESAEIRSAVKEELLSSAIATQKKTVHRSPSSYRIEQEDFRKSSSEFTRRGQLWSRHASWNLSGAPRSHKAMFKYPRQVYIRRTNHICICLYFYVNVIFPDVYIYVFQSYMHSYTHTSKIYKFL
jgi:hypothetical protein